MKIFNSDENQELFERDGYIKLKLLSESAAAHLLKFYYSLQKEHLEIKNLYHSTSDTSNSELIDKVDKEVMTTVLNETGHLFSDLDYLIGNFLVKESGKGSETKPHQDWTFVDENKNVSFNVWTGLHDISRNEGNLYFVPGSHKFIETLRVSPHYPWAFDKVYDLLPYYTKEEPTKAGEGFVINHACIHGATENHSGKPRVASVIAGFTKDAQLLHYYLENNILEKFLVNPNDFITLKKGLRPENIVPTIIEEPIFNQLEPKQFVKKINERYKGTDRIINKLKSYYLLNFK